MACHTSTLSLHYYFFYYAEDRFYRRPFHNTLFPVYDAIFAPQPFFHADMCRFRSLSTFRRRNNGFEIVSAILDHKLKSSYASKPFATYKEKA